MKNKFLISIILIFMIVNICSLKLCADDINVEEWVPSGTGSNQKIETIAGKILGVIQVCGTYISVIVLVVIGIKYMCGSIEEKAEYKKSMIPYIVGCILVFSTTNIAALLYDIGTGLSTTTENCGCRWEPCVQYEGGCHPECQDCRRNCK